MSKSVRELLRWWAGRGVGLLIALALALPAVPVAAAPVAQSDNVLQDCSAVNEETLQDELNRVSQSVFLDALARIDVQGVVDRQWVTLELDKAVDAAVVRAVGRVQSETDLWNKFLSAWNPDLAKELALTVTTYTFDDPSLRTALDDLSAAVAVEIADRVALLSADSVSAALFCLQTFIGSRYSTALVAAFQEKVQNATASAELSSDGVIPDIFSLVMEHQTALGGVGVIIAAQLARKLVVSLGQKLSQRVAGKIVGRVLGRAGSTIIPIAGWIIGAGMIAYDVYESREGALPQIQESLVSSEVKAGIREEITAAIRPELEAEVPELARTIANDLFGQWRTVKRDIRQVLDLAAEKPALAALLETLDAGEQLSNLVTLVTMLQSQGGVELDAALAEGSLARAAQLPAAVAHIAVESGSLATALAWAEVAGGQIAQIADYEIYRHVAPAAANMAEIERLLALGDRTAIARLLLLTPEQRGALLELATPTVTALAGALSPEELGWLAGQLPDLSGAQQNQLVARILSQPGVAAMLQSSGQLGAITSAADLDGAITFLMGGQGWVNLGADSWSVVTAGAEPGLFYAKYGPWTSLGVVAGLLLLLLVAFRLIWGLGAWLLAPFAAWRGKG